MVNLTLNEILNATGGTLVSGEKGVSFQGISTDSRTIAEGTLFVAIIGENFDGHAFLEEVAEKGAAGMLVSSSYKENLSGEIGKLPVIAVSDTLRAFQDIATFHRDKSNAKVVGITGSSGKTTTKEMIAAITTQKFKTLKNRGNFNNHMGVPATLLNLQPTDEVAVIEMGMNHTGEIERLCEIAKPEIGVITNIGTAHIEHLGSKEKIREAKGELLNSLGEEGVAILNADDPNVISLRKGFAGEVITFGIENKADIRAENIEIKASGYSFTLRSGTQAATVSLHEPGFHNVYNALAAAAVGQALQMDMESVAKGLFDVKPLPMRMEPVIKKGVTFINDTYNANPASMAAAIKTLAEYACAGKKILVAGDMLDLGNTSDEAHREIGKLAAMQGVDYFLALGEKSHVAAREALHNGMARDHVYQCDTITDVVLILREELEEGDCVLIKGSRGMKMERAFEGLIKMREAA